MPIASSFVRKLETAAAGYLESNLTKTKVRLWADAFANDQRVQTRSVVLFGHAGSEFGDTIFDPAIGEEQAAETLRFEIQLKMYDLRYHGDALDLMGRAMGLIQNYQPYAEFDGFRLIRYGNAKFDRADGSWTYTGEISTTYLGGSTLTPIADIMEPRIVEIGLYNIPAPENRSRDRFWS